MNSCGLSFEKEQVLRVSDWLVMPGTVRRAWGSTAELRGRPTSEDFPVPF
jgi:hypothetical protein